jgi:hypothetical protein
MISDDPRIIASKVYSSIAMIAQRNVADCMRKLRDARTAISQDPSRTENIDKWAAAHNELVREACVAIVFAAAALESYIYDYGARRRSDTFMKKYVDKLDIVAKWALVPELVAGKPFPTDRQGFALLRDLASARNQLIHFKSGPGRETMSADWLAEKAELAIQALHAMIKDMASFDPEELPWLQFSDGRGLWGAPP